VIQATEGTQATEVTQATTVMPATSNSKDDSMTARKSRNAKKYSSIRRDVNRADMPETVWKPTTHEFSRKFLKN
jgi:hypothetical protein